MNNNFGKIASPEMLAKLLREKTIETKNELFLLNFLVSATYGGYTPVFYTNRELVVILGLSRASISNSLISLKKKGFIGITTFRQRYGESKYKTQRTIELIPEKYYGTKEEHTKALEELKTLLKQNRENKITEVKTKPKIVTPTKKSKLYQDFEI